MIYVVYFVFIITEMKKKNTQNKVKSLIKMNNSCSI